MKKTGNLELFNLESTEPLILKPLNERLHAGGYGAFPSAALDFPDESIDFLKLLVKDPVTTFPGRISGDSLKDLGIVTTAANELMSIIHNSKLRMPICLNAKMAERFLNDEPIEEFTFPAYDPKLVAENLEPHKIPNTLF
ncbi:hypothetical protein PFY12_14575 [Chryseobacterium camelliae]|uniref:Uncharacterized protein n=1 Tax=Chryseobacterium camelliae TaxID=1265445 RepID=A0ABY7QKU7_9FLAO|nr:hypothetical protein [Chryseobacterium camelliae]WBV60250.1 hypothetical protein PFY12_14575 [Chryseobacterium camelliae]